MRLIGLIKHIFTISTKVNLTAPAAYIEHKKQFYAEKKKKRQAWQQKMREKKEAKEEGEHPPLSNEKN
ncbi:hypothetical protein [Candidatus Paracaedibacter symbiosus]|uniref:hypothetical protein n=1 Tax=Candidatus Paracaedibacter symbiosus TaxID=244582 RepID=UPI000509C2A7|nr:hypothetical protein [Candidatus Paracaedibacter symbiosus]